MTRIGLLVSILLGLTTTAASQCPPSSCPSSNDRWFVKAGVSNGSGTQASPFNNIEDALAAVDTDEFIYISAGTFKPADELTPMDPRSRTFLLDTSGMTLRGGWDGTTNTTGGCPVVDDATNVTILSGDLDTTGTDDAYHVVVVKEVGITLHGITIQDGRADVSGENSGGGVYDLFGSTTYRSCVITNNIAMLGGGVYAPQDIDVVTSTFENNSAIETGSGTLGHGAAIHLLFADDVNIHNCVFEGNAAEGNGGAIYTGLPCKAGTIANSGFCANSAGVEGAPAQGGAIFVATGICSSNGVEQINVINCTLRDNLAFATDGGGGLYSEIDEVVVRNTILWGNVAGGTGGQQIGLASMVSIDVQYSDVEGGFTGTENINIDPNFLLETCGYDISPEEGSPCVDAGSNAAVVADVLNADCDSDTMEDGPDLVLGTRIVNSRVDIGAIETDPSEAVRAPNLNACDLDGSTGAGVCDVLDVLAFQQMFVAGQMAADCDRDGTLDVHDFTCFQLAFSAQSH